MNRLLRRVAVATTLAIGSAHAAPLTPTEEIFKAVSIDDLRDTRRLLQERVVEPKVVDPRGDTLLIVAIRSDASRVAEYLIADTKTDLEATNASNETALMIAAYRKRRDLVEKLLARDAEVNRVGWTALHYAASVDARDIVALLLEHSAYIDAESPNRTTPLMMAARGGFGDLCRQLVEAGADPSAVNERDLSASDFARRAGDAALADWLAERDVAWRAKYRLPARPPAR